VNQLTKNHANDSIASMDSQANQQLIETRITALTSHLTTIEQHLMRMIDENKRLRDVVRLAESELRKRRDRVQELEVELQRYQAQQKNDADEHAVADTQNSAQNSTEDDHATQG